MLCEIKTWNELSLFYSKVKGMFDMIFMFLFIIVLVIVVMSVVNTMGMAVLERTREIGTLRALGLKRRGVGLLFAIEGAMIGLLGSILGVILNIIAWFNLYSTRDIDTCCIERESRTSSHDHVDGFFSITFIDCGDFTGETGCPAKCSGCIRSCVRKGLRITVYGSWFMV